MLTGMVISVGCAALGSLRGSRAVLRLQPAEAMRPKPPRSGGAVFWNASAGSGSRSSSGWRMVLRNVLRNRCARPPASSPPPWAPACWSTAS